MIKSDHLVKKHQIKIFKIFRIFHITFHTRFAVSEIIIGKITYQSSGKGWKIVETWTFIIRKDLAEIIRRMLCNYFQISDFHFAIDTGDLQFRIKAKKRISSPCLVCLGGF